MHATSDDDDERRRPRAWRAGRTKAEGLDQEAAVREPQRRRRAARIRAARRRPRAAAELAKASTRSAGAGAAGGRSGAVADGVRSVQWTSQALASATATAARAARGSAGRMAVAGHPVGLAARIGPGGRSSRLQQARLPTPSSPTRCPRPTASSPHAPPRRPGRKAAPAWRSMQRGGERRYAGARGSERRDDDGGMLTRCRARGNLSRGGNVDPGQGTVRAPFLQATGPAEPRARAQGSAQNTGPSIIQPSPVIRAVSLRLVR